MRKLLFYILAFTFCFAHSFVQGQIRREVNNNASHSNQNQTNQSASVTPTPIEQPIEKHPKADETNTQSKEIQTAPDWSKWSAIGTLAGTIISLIVLFAVLRQAQISNHSLKEMRRQADTMDASLGETRNTIRQNERAIKASQRQARSSEKMLKMSEELFYISERAYVGIETILLEPPLSPTQSSELITHIINTGKTPAWDVSFDFCIVVELLARIVPPDFSNAPENKISVELLPGIKTKVAGNAPLAFNEEAFAMMRNGTGQLAVYVKIQYNCIQHRQEVDYFKYVYSLDPPRFIKMKGHPAEAEIKA